MKNFSELIGLRRSHRKFTTEPVDENSIKALLRSALIAPSSKGLHSYEFVVVKDRDNLQALSRCKDMGADFIAEAPLAVVVLGNPEVSDVWIEDASVASTQMLLQAEDLGLGACWVQVRDRHDKEGASAEENVKHLLHIPATMRVLSIIAVGHKGMERKPQNEDRLKWEKVHNEAW